MSVAFTSRGLSYGSTPVLPILEGSSVVVVSSSVGYVSQNLQHLRHVGQVKHIYLPGTEMHHWWSFKHNENFFVPRKKDTLYMVEFFDGRHGLFILKNLVRCVWLSTDILPSKYPVHLNLNISRP